MDVITVFLNKKINIKLYINQPIKYSKKDKIYKILHTFYNLKQSRNI